MFLINTYLILLIYIYIYIYIYISKEYLAWYVIIFLMCDAYDIFLIIIYKMYGHQINLK